MKYYKLLDTGQIGRLEGRHPRMYNPETKKWDGDGTILMDRLIGYDSSESSGLYGLGEINSKIKEITEEEAKKNIKKD